MPDRSLAELRAEALELLGRDLCPNALRVVRSCLRKINAMLKLEAGERETRV